MLLIALGITLALFFIRYLIFRVRSDFEISANFFLIFSPNLTVVAVAAEMLLLHNAHRETIELLLATGFFMTIGSALFLPTKASTAKKEEVFSLAIEIENFTPELEV